MFRPSEESAVCGQLVGSNTTDLNCQFGDAGLNGPTSVADAYVHAVILGVIQAERPHFQNDGCCTVCEKEKITNRPLIAE